MYEHTSSGLHSLFKVFLYADWCNGSLSVREYVPASSDEFCLLVLHKYERETKPGVGRPSRENEWLQITDHRKKTNDRSDPLICVQQSNTMFSVINSIKLFRPLSPSGAHLFGYFPLTSAAHLPHYLIPCI